MNIHEYQAKELLKRHGVTLPPGTVVDSPTEARAAAKALLDAGARRIVLKAQIHAGGRGKGAFTNGFQGGVKLTTSPDEVEAFAGQMLDNVLVTKQTGPAGRQVRKLLIAEAPQIEREIYLAVLLDRATSRPIVMASSEGGVDIEEVAEHSPEKIIRQPVDPAFGLPGHAARRIAGRLGLGGAMLNRAASLIQGVYHTWWECDASMVEINPLCVIRTPEGAADLWAVDAKISLDDNALFRHPDIRDMRDTDEESPLETEASRHDLNYIKLDGNIACLVNGAGLAMATMDIIKHCGGEPANFLDVGGGASVEQVTAAFRIIMKDPGVQAILVNIFGGIMDCDVIARGIVAAVKETGLELPLVVRLEGNNVTAGKRTLADSGLPIISGDSMADAAAKVVAAVVG